MELNPKCLIFGMILSIFYMLLACNPKLLALPAIISMAYFSMAVYDKLYLCQRTLP